MTQPAFSATPEGHRFPCTPGGAIAAGRRRLFLVLVGLSLAMVAFATWTWFSTGKWVPTLLGLGVAAVAWTAWRMSGDLAPLWIELGDHELTVQMKRARSSFALEEIEARKLTESERRHVALLATQAGVVAGTGGFDSHKLGEFDLFATHLDHAVWIETGEQALIVTPDNPQVLLDALRSRPGGREVER